MASPGKDIKTASKTTAGIAVSMMDKFVTNIENFGRMGIWNSRCQVTISWEKSVGIATESKRSRRSIRDREHGSSGGDASDFSCDNDPYWK
ncbi:hypothetical protein BGZ83_006871 [Gryganskiella cystojenkinii]|nr:hypothetical protein BGZ83_006871 [Gryganskiella cystojenkinii]